MKRYLLTLPLFAFITIGYGQSTWMQRISYNLGLAGTFIHPDSVCGIQDIAVSPDGNLYMVGKKSQSNMKEMFKMTPGNHVVLWTGAESYESVLHGDDNSFVRATADSGCILAINFHAEVTNGWGATTIIKYSKTGAVQWSDSLGFDNGNLTFPAYNKTEDIIENAAGNYYVLMAISLWVDSLYEFDNAGALVLQTAAVHGNKLFEMSNGDLLVHQTNHLVDDSLVRIDLAGAVSWAVPTYINDLFAFSAAAVFVCHSDIVSSLSVIRKIDAGSGTVIWTDTVPSAFISAIDATMDGGVIGSEGTPATFTCGPQVNMNGKLYKIDGNGTTQWTHTYTFPQFGLSTVKQYPDGRYITGGTYHACDLWYQFERDYSGFAAMLDSSGNGDLETASNIWPGDANGNDTLWMLDDLLYMALALNSTGSPRDTIPTYMMYFDHIFNSDYAIDWPQTFANGTNYKHADFDGDGVVELSEITSLLPFQIFWSPEAVNCRIGEETFSSSLPDLLLLPEKDSVAPGETMRFYIVAGTSSLQVDSLFGIAFTNDFDATLTDTSFVNVNFFNSDFGNPATNLMGLSYHYPGQLLVLADRSDKQNVFQLHDTLGVIELKANPNITAPQIFNLQVSSLYAMTNSTSPVSFNTINGTVEIDPALVSVPENPLYTQSIYPNPADKFLRISDLPEGEKDFVVYNILGEKNKFFHTNESSLEITVSDLKSGIYNLLIFSKAGTRNLKFIVKH
jgi:hypothetical protein